MPVQGTESGVCSWPVAGSSSSVRGSSRLSAFTSTNACTYCLGRWGSCSRPQAAAAATCPASVGSCAAEAAAASGSIAIAGSPSTAAAADEASVSACAGSAAAPVAGREDGAGWASLLAASASAEAAAAAAGIASAASPVWASSEAAWLAATSGCGAGSASKLGCCSGRSTYGGDSMPCGFSHGHSTRAWLPSATWASGRRVGQLEMVAVGPQFEQLHHGTVPGKSSAWPGPPHLLGHVSNHHSRIIARSQRQGTGQRSKVKRISSLRRVIARSAKESL